MDSSSSPPPSQPPKVPIVVLPLECTNCHKDMGAILAKTLNINDVIKKEDHKMLCKECYEGLQESIRDENASYSHIRDYER